MPARKNKTKSAIEFAVAVMLNGANLHFEREYRFDPDRKWRADFMLPAHKIIIECEGMSGGGGKHIGGHRSWTGFLNDIEKYNRATELGYVVFRCVSEKISDTDNAAYVVERVLNLIASRERKSDKT